MNLSVLVDLAGTGATWVLYALIALSAIQLAIILERAIAFRRTRASRTLSATIRGALTSGGAKAVALAVVGERSLEGCVARAGAAAAERGAPAAQELMRAALIEHKLGLERGLSFLGTLGANAPFLGLFGTVLGVIHATQDLSNAAGHAGAQVMSGISEALVSTAVGLLVALPAVAAFNYFQRALKTRAVAAEGLSGEIIAHLVTPVLPSTSGSFRKAA
jgi:biopolymer transport protein ExbB